MNKTTFTNWKYAFFILITMGVSNIGQWVFLLSLNLLILNYTHSPLAISLLYIMAPISAIITNSWSGSIIDRCNQKFILIILDLLRCISIFLILLTQSLIIIYIITLIISMFSSVFAPTSKVYINNLLPNNLKKRFNALRSLVDSSGFILGPAIAGIIFMYDGAKTGLLVTSLTFFISAIITIFMPKTSTEFYDNEKPLSLKTIANDWLIIFQFSKNNRFIFLIYFSFTVMMVFATAIDSQEVSFAKYILHLNDSNYGFLVSIAGTGIILGSLLCSLYGIKFSDTKLIGWGSLILSIGYILYSISNTFLQASIGFFMLSFFMAFASTGFHSFYQRLIPSNLLGRFVSLVSIIEAILIIILTIIFGITSEILNIRFTVVLGSISMFIITLYIFGYIERRQVKRK
ncbi:MFS transporter [Staphylococcus xylosus]|uniref:MFS transporter n=1 Tax=Staphylococcus xylosus TaxID=1288 RepID=UPI003F56AD78